MDTEHELNEMGVRMRKMNPRRIRPEWRSLTPLLRETLNYFWDYSKKNGFLPSYREAGRHFGVTHSAIEHRMWSIEQLGLIQKDYHTSRSFKFLKDKRSWRVTPESKVKKMRKKSGLSHYLNYLKKQESSIF